VQYELRYQVIEPKRHAYQNVIDRLGDQPASRYLEATLDVQPRENFHYRPTWAVGREAINQFCRQPCSSSYDVNFGVHEHAVGRRGPVTIALLPPPCPAPARHGEARSLD
jgi:hypothetical protein